MKLRQKLAVALASAMVVTAVPVVTMATATTTLKREVITIKKNEIFATTATANAVKVTFDNDKINGTDTIYLTLENAEWSNAAFNLAENKINKVEGKVLDTWEYNTKDSNNDDVKLTFEKQSSKVMKVRIDNHSADSTVFIPLLAKATGGDAKVTVENKGNGTLSKTSSYIFATTGEKKFKYEVGDIKTFYRDGELSKLILTEAFPGSLKNGAQFRLELDDTDFYFKENMTIKAKGMYGFGGETIEPTFEIDPDNNKDTASILITIPAVRGDGTLGTIELTGIEVRSSSKTPEEGDFLVDIKSVNDSVVGAKDNVVLGKVTKYGTYIKMKDDKAEDVKAGRIEEIEFSVGEGVEDSMISDREFEIKSTNGHFDYKGLVKDYIASLGNKADAYIKKALDKTTATYSSDNDYKYLAANIDPAWLAKKIINNDEKWNIGTGAHQTNVEFDVDSDGKAITDTLVVYVGYYGEKATYSDYGATQSNEHEDEMKFKLKVCVPVNNKEKEKVTLTASGRSLENEVTTTAINIINPFDVEYTQANLKVGLQGQVSGSLKLTETDKDMFQKGDITFAIKNGNEELGIYLTDVEFETSSSIKGEKTSTSKGTGKSATVKLNRVTKEAGSIEFKSMTFTADRTVPEGTYDLEIKGAGIDADGHRITVKDFIKITTTNTQDITASGLAKGTSTFVIGESKYTFQDKEYTMDAPSYIQDPGYTMVPVRYVAQAFGVAEKDIMFGKGTVTIFAGERTISLTNGSNIAVVNGNSITMGAAVVIKDGRTYAPASQIASLLGISSNWDAATKTATFTNN